MGSLFSLTDRVALITGGSRGLGFQLASALGRAGAKVVITARKQAELDAAAEALGSEGIRVATVACDMQDLDSIPALVDELITPFGEFNLLVNNAGTNWAAPAEDYPLDGWNKVMNLNTTAPFLLTREIGRRFMIPARDGKILNIASIGALRGNRPDMQINAVAYNTSKAAMINFTRALAGEWGRYNINVNALCPGFFPTKMSQGELSSIEQQVVEATPLARLGDDQDIHGPAVFLLSEAARHITGTALAIDGGATAVQ